MPIYEYKCKKCGKEFELFQKMSDPVIKTCRFCNGPVTKLISLSSFHLKGTGWYVTDYGGKKTISSESKKEEAGKSETPSTEKGESPSSASSEK